MSSISGYSLPTTGMIGEMLAFPSLCNLTGRYRVAPKIKAESTLKAQSLPYLTV